MTGPSRPSPGMMAAGFAAATYLLIGRWSPARLLGSEAEPGEQVVWHLVLEPRFWCVLVLLGIALKTGPKQWTAPPWGSRGPLDKVLGFVFLLFFFLLFSISWSPFREPALLKGYEVLLMLGTLVSVHRFLAQGWAQEFNEAFWITGVFQVGALAVLGLWSFSSSERLAVLGGGPNVFGRLMGLLAIGTLELARRGHVAWAPVTMVALALVVLSGSRGALFATAVAFGAYLFCDPKKWKKKIVILGFVGVAGYVLVSYTAFGAAVAEMYESRVQVLTFEQGYTSGRSDIIDLCFEEGSLHPFLGAGLAGWGDLGDEPYPHNLILELYFEGGLVAVALLLGALICAVWHWLAQRRALNPANIAGFVLVLIASQLSGDLYDSRGVFLFLPLSLIPDPSTMKADGRA